MSEVREFPTRGRKKPPPPPALSAPQFDLEAEQSALGCMMFSRVAADEILAKLTALDFYRDAHQELFRVIREVHAHCAPGPADPILVHDQLVARGLLGPKSAITESGGMPYIHTLLQAAPTAANAGHYASLIARKAQLRAVQTAAVRAAQAASEGEQGPEAIISAASRELAHIADTGSDIASPDPNVREFLDEEEDEYDFVVPSLLERGDRLLLTGPEGKGKSTLLRQFAVQCAAGVHPFALLGIAPIRVLLVDLENPKRVFKRELRTLMAKVPKMDASRLVPISRPEGIDLCDEHDARWLRSRIVANTPDLVIIGPLYKLHRGDPTEEGPAREVAALFDDLRTRYGFALVIEAHSPHAQGPRERRPERPYGASLWMRWPEFGLYLDAPPLDEDRAAPLRHWRGARDERDWPPALKRGGQWLWTVTELDDELTQRPHRVSTRGPEQRLGEILSHLERVGPCSLRDIRKAIGGRHETKDEAITLGLETGQIVRLEDGRFAHPDGGPNVML